MLPSTARRNLTTRGLLVLKSSSTTTRQFQSSSRFAAGDGGAFDPKTTDPAKQDAGNEDGHSAYGGTGTGTNPVDSSANKARNPQEGGSQGSKAEDGKGKSDREGPSGSRKSST